MENKNAHGLTIGMTQRVDVAATGERRDGLDQQWQRLFSRIGMVMLPLPNLSLPFGDSAGAFKKWYDAFPINALVMSGGATPVGGDVPKEETTPERDAFESFLIEGCSAARLPVLGVCRGMQMLARHFGAELTHVDGHVAVRHPIVRVAECGSVLPDEVNSYHNYAIKTDGLPSCLEAVVIAEDGNVEAFRHRALPVFAMMWHPERETPFRESELRFINHFLTTGNTP